MNRLDLVGLQIVETGRTRSGIRHRFVGHAVVVDQDLTSLVEATFGVHASEALAALSTIGASQQDREPDRTRRAVFALSEGDLGRLHHFVDRAHQDYRDVLMWAETEPESDEPRTYDELRRRIGLTPDEGHTES